MKRARSRSPSPSPVKRVEELQAEETRLKAQLEDVREKLATHPDAIRARVNNNFIPDTVLARVTRLTEPERDGQYRRVHVTLDGTPFVFSQQEGNRHWLNEDEYERDNRSEMVHGIKKGKKVPLEKWDQHSWADEIESMLDEDSKYREPYEKELKNFTERYAMPLLDIEAAFVAFSVFFNNKK